MTITIMRHTAFIFLALFCSSLFANEAFNMQQLQELFNKYQRKAAYDYAAKYIMQMEGNPNFDYIYGVSAIDTGHASQGVFALERVLLAFPEDHVARLELARGYFILEEYARSREEFETVLATNPPKGVQQTTQSFLDQIRLKEARYRTTSNGFIALGYGSDSNVNSAPPDGTIIGNIFILTGDAVELDDNYSELTAAWQIDHPFSPGWIWNTELTANLKQNQDYDQFDTSTLTLQAGVTRIISNSRYNGSAVIQQYQLDGDEYRNLAGVNMDWKYSLSQQSSINTSIQFAQLGYPTRPNSDSNLMTASLGYSHAFATRLLPTLFTSISLGSEDAKNNNAEALGDTERDIVSANIGLALNLTSRLSLQTSAGFQMSDYASINSLEPVIREDDMTSFNCALLWLFNKNWRLDTTISSIDNSSNIDAYEFDRTLINLSAHFSF